MLERGSLRRAGGQDFPTHPAMVLLLGTAPRAPAAWQPLTPRRTNTDVAAGGFTCPPPTQAPEITACSTRMLPELYPLHHFYPTCACVYIHCKMLKTSTELSWMKPAPRAHCCVHTDAHGNSTFSHLCQGFVLRWHSWYAQNKTAKVCMKCTAISSSWITIPLFRHTSLHVNTSAKWFYSCVFFWDSFYMETCTFSLAHSCLSKYKQWNCLVSKWKK